MSKDLFKNTSRGGQVILHNLRMVCQVFGKVLLWLSPVFFIAGVFWFSHLTDSVIRSIGKQWLNAEINQFFNGKHHALKSRRFKYEVQIPLS